MLLKKLKVNASKDNMKKPFNIIINQYKGINLYLNEFNLPVEYSLDVDGYIPQGDKLVADSASVERVFRPYAAYSWKNFIYIYNDANDTSYRVIFRDNGSGKYQAVFTPVSDLSSELLVLDTDTVSTHIPFAFEVNGEFRIKNADACVDTNYIVKYFNTSQFNAGITYTGIGSETSEILSPVSSTQYFTATFTETANEDSKLLSGDVIEYNFSYVYDVLQEGLLGESITHTVLADKQSLNISLVLNSANTISKRVTAINVYRRINNSKWYYLQQIEINDSSWVYDGVAFTASITIVDDGFVLTDTYNARCGVIDGYEVYDPMSNHYALKWETATINAGRAFYGNCHKWEKKYGTGSCTEYNDRVYFSDPGRYDIIKSWNYFDLGTGDGDNIIHLDSFGNELLVFKEHNLYVFSVGSMNVLEWKLVAKRAGVNIDDWRAITHTPYGLIFISNNNLYLYTGNGQIQEIAKSIRGYITQSVVYSNHYNALFIYYYDSANSRWYTYLTSFEYSYIVRSKYYGTSGYEFLTAFVDYDGTACMLIHDLSGAVLQVNTLTAGDSQSFITGKFTIAGLQKRIKSLYIEAVGTADVKVITETGTITYSSQAFGTGGSTLEFYPNTLCEWFQIEIDRATQIGQISVQGEEYNKGM